MSSQCLSTRKALHGFFVSAGILALAATSPGAAQADTPFNFTGGLQFYTVPTTGLYDITAFGAHGGGSGFNQGGSGAEIGGVVDLTSGQVLSILVGGAGAAGSGVNGSDHGAGLGGGGGGGGTFVVAGGNPLVIAGGGGGAGGYSDGYGSSSINGKDAGGNGGFFYVEGGGGGGGFDLNGMGGSGGGGGFSFNAGGAGGTGGGIGGICGFSGGEGGNGGFGGGGGGGAALVSPFLGNCYDTSAWHPGAGGGGGGYGGGNGGGGYGGGFSGGGGGSFLAGDVTQTVFGPSIYRNGFVDISLVQAAPAPAPALGEGLQSLALLMLVGLMGGASRFWARQ